VADDVPPELDAATLDRLRRGFALRLDATGAMTFEGDAVTHPRVVRFLRRCLDLDPEGRAIIAHGAWWAFVDVADLPLRVLRVTAGEDGAPLLHLDDERAAPLQPRTLVEDPGRGMRCTVPSAGSGREIGARFSNTAVMDLERWLDWPEGAARPRLVIHGSTFEIPESCAAALTEGR
jgi:hypothetical protein